MANLINEKLKSVYKLLRERNLTIISDISDDLRCVICNEIPIDAYVTNCGCKFCKECIDNYKDKGGTHCPGNTEHCQYEDLSELLKDQSANVQISRLIVKCVNESCDFNCELMKMEMHMVTCSKKSINCPFEIVGCKEKLNGDKVNEHLQRDSFTHSKLLIEIINNLKNEVNEMREIEKINQTEMTILKENVVKQKCEMEIIQESVELMKTEIENKASEIEKLKDEMRKKVDLKNNNERFHSMEIEMKEELNKMIKMIKSETKSLNGRDEKIIKDLDIMNSNNSRKYKQMDSINKEMEINKNEMARLNSKLGEIITGTDNNIKVLKTEIRKMMTEKNEERKEAEDLIQVRMKCLEKYVDTKDDIFVWNIGRINKFEITRYYYSKYFYNRNKPYKMGLKLCRWSEEGFFIWLLVYCGTNDKDLSWPFRANVTFKLAHIYDQDKTESCNKICVIDQPMNNKCNLSDDFVFYTSNLMSVGQSYNCIIECIIDYLE